MKMTFEYTCLKRPEHAIHMSTFGTPLHLTIRPAFSNPCVRSPNSLCVNPCCPKTASYLIALKVTLHKEYVPKETIPWVFDCSKSMWNFPYSKCKVYENTNDDKLL